MCLKARVFLLLSLFALITRVYSLEWKFSVTKEGKIEDFIDINSTYSLNVQLCSDNLIDCDQSSREVELLGGVISISPATSQVYLDFIGVPEFTDNLMWKATFTTGSTYGQTNFVLSNAGNKNKLISLAIGGTDAFSPAVPINIEQFSSSEPLPSLSGLNCKRIVETSPLTLCLLDSHILLSQNEFQDTFIVDLTDLIPPILSGSACEAKYGSETVFWNAVSFQEYTLIHTSSGIFKLVSTNALSYVLVWRGIDCCC
jgi:hypothetical protein